MMGIVGQGIPVEFVVREKSQRLVSVGIVVNCLLRELRFIYLARGMFLFVGGLTGGRRLCARRKTVV